MNVIGQEALISEIDDLCVNNNFPKVSTIIGRAGCGKTHIANYISQKLEAQIIEINSIDDIRDIIESAPNFMHNIVALITSFEALNFRAKEALLKLCEDTPNRLYIIIEVTNSSMYDDRFKNRSQIFTLSPYSKTQMHDICALFKPDITDSEFKTAISVYGTPKDIKEALNYGLDSIFSFANKVMLNIQNANEYNAMKIAESLSLKQNDGKLSFNLFFKALQNLAFAQYKKTRNNNDYRFFCATSDAYNSLINTNRINKRCVFDKWILDIKTL